MKKIERLLVLCVILCVIGAAISLLIFAVMITFEVVLGFAPQSVIEFATILGLWSLVIVIICLLILAVFGLIEDMKKGEDGGKIP